MLDFGFIRMFLPVSDRCLVPRHDNASPTPSPHTDDQSDDPQCPLIDSGLDQEGA
jgi:hypothetical protein